MLKFINDIDHTLVDNFSFTEDGSISWQYADGNRFHSGLVRAGLVRTYREQDGFKSVEVGTDPDTGEPVLENFIEVSLDIHQKLLDLADKGDITIHDEDPSLVQERAVDSFRASRQALVNSATVETSEGNVYDADEQSITRMMGRLLRIRDEADSYELQWSLNTDGTGIPSTVTKADLQEAYDLAVDQLDSIWLIRE